MTKPILDSLLWRQYKSYYVEKEGQIIWKEDTPEKAIQSYEYYCRQMEQLKQMTQPVSPIWPRLFQKKDSIDKLALAKAFLEKRWQDNSHLIKARVVDQQVVIFWKLDQTNYISVIYFKNQQPIRESRYIKAKG